MNKNTNVYIVRNSQSCSNRYRVADTGWGRNISYSVAATMRHHFFEIYKEVFIVLGAWHSPNALLTMVHGQAFRILT
jgi:hypothetical protein